MPQTATIRDATLGDVPAMFDIRGLVDENRMTRSELAAIGITEDVIREGLDDQLTAWIAECDGDTVGFSMADRTRGCVYAVFVLPAFQRRGMGKALLDRASAWLFELGYLSVFLNTDQATRAYQFYLRLGWVDSSGPDQSPRRLELNPET